MKSSYGQLMRGASAIGISQIVANIAAFIMMWSIARGMGEASYGIYAAAYALANSLSTFAETGIRPALVRGVAQDPDTWQRLMRLALLISGGMGCLVLLIFIGVSLSQGGNISESLRIWLLMFALIWSLYRVALGVLAGRNRMVSVAYWGAAERIANAIVISSLAFSPDASLIVIAKSMCAVEILLVASLLWWILTQKWDSGKTKISFVAFCKTAWPFAFCGISYAILGRADLVVLGFQVEPEVIGYYASAQVLAVLGLFAATSLSRAIFPTLAQLAKAEQNDKALELLMPTLGICVLLILTINSILIAGAPFWMAWIYGPTFIHGAAWLEALSLSALFSSLGSVFGVVVAAWGWQMRWAKVVFITTIIGLPLYWLAASYAGVWGVLLVSIGIQVFFNWVSWRWLIRARLHDTSNWFAKVLLLSIGVSGVLLLLGVGHPMLWLLVPLLPVLVILTGICRIEWIKSTYDGLLHKPAA